ncbi:CoA-binding protein [Phanerochaete sordida]|uniref:CoA-binding protein n=1 Tax=Phanerochaete sordida TaxID=48140 RepID=A0A9P3GDL6_9APHY|nr:CoA-binding protein [Phanerochaete sordida]
MPGTEEQKHAFLAAPHFAVVGASKDETKVGTKVLKWYAEHGKDVTPVHPKETEIQGHPTVRALADLPDPSHTSVSVVTGPKITLGLLKDVKALGVPHVWLQPGTHDEAVEEYIKENGLSDKVVYGGACVLVEGDGLLKSA